MVRIRLLHFLSCQLRKCALGVPKVVCIQFYPDEQEKQMEWEEAGKPSGHPADSTVPITPQQNSPQGAPNMPGPSKGKKTKRKVIIIVVAVLLVLFGISRCASCSSKDYVSWPTSGLATQLPKPDSSKISVSVNSDTKLSAEVDDFKQEAYSKYVDSCKEKGFTVDAESDTSSYKAYNSEGYYVNLIYYGSSGDMSISLDAPLKADTVSWPTSGPGALLPKPVSDKGAVSSNTSTRFCVTLANTDKAAFEAYVNEVSAAGFDVDFSKQDKSFSAKDASGNKVSVKYEGNNQMEVAIDAAKEGSDSSSSASSGSSTNTSGSTATSNASSSSSSSSTDANGVTVSFKKTMDDYEAGMNSYCDFMEKYINGGRPASMAADYANYVKKLADLEKDFDAIDESSLTAADDAYYIEVQSRVNQRLTAVAQ